MRPGRLILRTVVGALFIGHGTQKLLGWFGGQGLDATGQFFESVGLRPGPRNALAAGLSEAGGGALLALGLLTPLAAAALVGAMTTAIRIVHLKNGPWSANGGYEYNLVLIAAVLALVDGGPGRRSLDRVLSLDDTGAGGTLATLAAGVAGSTFTIEAARRREPTAPPAPAETLDVA